MAGTHDGVEEPREEGLDARSLLRHALVDGEDPRFPWWLPLPGLVLAVGWAAFRAASAAASTALDAGAPVEVFLGALLWPGTAVFLFATLATWFGWQLEID